MILIEHKLSVYHKMHPMATHSSILAWRIPGTGEPGGLPSMGSHRVEHDSSDLAAAAAAQNVTFWLQNETVLQDPRKFPPSTFQVNARAFLQDLFHNPGNEMASFLHY